MKRFLLCIIALTAFCIAPFAHADLDADIAAVLRDKLIDKISVGVVILRLGSTGEPGKLLYAHNPDLPLMPASNMKILTTSAALDTLGADFHFQTLLLQRGDDLVLLGDGDPMFGDWEFLHKSNWDITSAFKLWADKLKKANLTRFHNVLVDDTVFDQEFVHPNWAKGTQYCGQIAGMNLNIGQIDFYIHYNGPGKPVGYRTNPATGYVTVTNTCVGGGQNAIVLDHPKGSNRIALRGSALGSSTSPLSVAIHDPALYAAQVLAETLKAEGITISGGFGRDKDARAQLLAKDPVVAVLAGHESTLAQVISRTNKDSQNLYAETLCKRTGYAVSGKSGTWENGAAATAAFLRKAGVADGACKLDDGCGLSRNNAVTASALAAVLRYNFTGKNRDLFLSTLAVAGVDGTLNHRFKGPAIALRDRVYAKSGFIEGVSALSGYLKAKDDSCYAFSILMNGLPAYSNTHAKELQEQIVLAIDRHADRK